MRRQVTCEEYDEAVESIGGIGDLEIVASHTSMDGWYFHSTRHIFTRWSLNGKDWSETLRRGDGDDEACEHWLLSDAAEAGP